MDKTIKFSATSSRIFQMIFETNLSYDWIVSRAFKRGIRTPDYYR